MSSLPTSDLPGAVVKVDVEGQSYHDLITKAYELFDGFFDGESWDFIGAEVQPGVTAGDMGGKDTIFSWVGTFYALAHSLEGK